MPSTYQRYLTLAAILAGLAVALGAFAAHILKPLLEPRLLAAFTTGSEYQMTHALGLLAAAWIGQHHPNNIWFVRAMRCFAAGILLFSGSLYMLSLTGVNQLGMITPLGGICMISAWSFLALAFYTNSKH
ncbi:MAG: DUF423 domain-containing protein [Gammaproteobacteria bacterium]|jgi:uncharacterized membrane protein YgdD (TMEM256/DUF423 family)|nr:DUF423 domain-containing protein [Gammaproteobacteria bacterium]